MVTGIPQNDRNTQGKNKTMTQHNGDLDWQQGQVVGLTIHDVNHDGDGVGRVGDRVVFVPDTVPGDRLLVRLVYLKRGYALGKIQDLIEPSPHRIRPRCLVADKCGGCQWHHIADETQRTLKRDRVQQTLARVGGLEDLDVLPLMTAEQPLGYRNKVTYPLGRGSEGQIQAGYYRRGSHRLVNLNQCPIQDSRLDSLLRQVKQDISDRRWSVYDEKTGRGQLRHLSLRIGRRTGEMLLTLISRTDDLPGMEKMAAQWLREWSDLVGVHINLNPKPGNAIWGEETRCLAGRETLREIFGGLTFHLRPETFFQVNTEAAELMLQTIADRLALTGQETLVDAYCGLGTFTLPLAVGAKRAIGLEWLESSVYQARENAVANGLEQVEFHSGKVEHLLADWLPEADVLLIDPPRKGCDPAVVNEIAQDGPPRVVYISCNPATLARDLKQLTQGDRAYRITLVQPVDFFPQTSHVETLVFLER